MEYTPRNCEAVTPKDVIRGRSRLLAVFVILVAGTVLICRWHAALPGSTSELSVRELSDFYLDPTNGSPAEIPSKFKALDGKRITLVGNMWNTQFSDKGVHDFQLTYPRDSELRPPYGQEFVSCQADQPVPLYDDEVRATGIFHIRIIRRDGIIASVFSLDVDQMKPVDEKKPPVDVSERASFLDIY